MDSGNEHHNIRREPDVDADGESIDEDASPLPSHHMGLHRVGFPSSLHHEVSVCVQYFVCYGFPHHEHPHRDRMQKTRCATSPLALTTSQFAYTGL